MGHGDPIVPFAGFESFEDCLETMTEGEGHDEASAEDICGALQAEEKSEHGDPEGLLQALRNASGLIADVGVDLVSGVDVPAVDSKWVMFKDGGGRRGHDYRVDTPVLLDKDAADAEKRIAYAAAMIPREPDKEGDVAPTATVEKAAHDFLKDGGGIDTDHSLIDGEGDPVESWILKADWEFDLPDGGSETYPEGTWMLGIEWGAEAWQRIKDGELTGLSIYGMAQHVPLERASSCVECGDRLTTKAPATEGMGSDDPPIEITDDAAQALAQELSEPLSEAAGTAVKDALPEDIDKQSADELIQEFAERLAETGETDKEADTIAEAIRSALEGEPLSASYDDVREVAEGVALATEAEKAVGMDTIVDLLAEVEDVAAPADEIADAIGPLFGEGGEVEESTEEAGKSPNFGKGADATETAQKGITGDGDAGSLSYQALAEQHEGGA